MAPEDLGEVLVTLGARRCRLDAGEPAGDGAEPAVVLGPGPVGVDELPASAADEIPPHLDRLLEGRAAQEHGPNGPSGLDGQLVAPGPEVAEVAGPERLSVNADLSSENHEGVLESLLERQRCRGLQREVDADQRGVVSGGARMTTEASNEQGSGAAVEFDLGQRGMVLEGGLTVPGLLGQGDPELDTLPDPRPTHPSAGAARRTDASRRAAAASDHVPARHLLCQAAHRTLEPGAVGFTR